MTRWFGTHGHLLRVGVEGYGAGDLMAAGIEVVEVNRPNRQLRRQRGGKTDSVAVPKSGDGPVECIRCCWWPAVRLPRPAPRPLTRYIL